MLVTDLLRAIDTPTPTPIPTPAFSATPAPLLTATPDPVQTSDPNIDPFFPPLNYDWPWWLVLPLFIALLVAWILISKSLARRDPAKAKQAAGPVKAKVLPLPVDVRRQAMARIDAIEAEVKAGTLSPRDAHIELSSVLRELAFFTTRFDARSMTLSELRNVGLSRLADTVSQFYPIAFAPGEAIDATQAISIARQAVMTWN
ncbi:hypothetical protein BH11ACT3_BH11ACT3_20960 [soil metagenome]